MLKKKKRRNSQWYEIFYIGGIIDNNDWSDSHDQNTVNCFTSFRNLEHMFVCVRKRTHLLKKSLPDLRLLKPQKC